MSVGSFRVEINYPSVAAKVKEAFNSQLEKVAAEYLKDANYFVRVDSGAMRESSYTSSDLKNGLLVWVGGDDENGGYAKKVYYTGTPSKDNNVHAELMWADLPRQRNPEKYAKMWSDLLK